eukprot:6733368-Lingulodinium_polyedra.AAC.1
MWFEHAGMWACAACGCIAQRGLRGLADSCRGHMSKECAHAMRCLERGLRPNRDALCGGIRVRPAASGGMASRLAEVRGRAVAAAKLRESVEAACAGPVAPRPEGPGALGASEAASA